MNIGDIFTFVNKYIKIIDYYTIIYLNALTNLLGILFIFFINHLVLCDYLFSIGLNLAFSAPMNYQDCIIIHYCQTLLSDSKLSQVPYFYNYYCCFLDHCLSIRFQLIIQMKITHQLYQSKIIYHFHIQARLYLHISEDFLNKQPSKQKCCLKFDLYPLLIGFV